MSTFNSNSVEIYVQVSYIILVISFFGAFGGLTSNYILGIKPYEEKTSNFINLTFIGSILVGISSALSAPLIIFPLFNVKIDPIFNSEIANFEKGSLYIQIISISIISGFAGRSILPRISNNLSENIKEVENKIDRKSTLMNQVIDQVDEKIEVQTIINEINDDLNKLDDLNDESNKDKNQILNSLDFAKKRIEDALEKYKNNFRLLLTLARIIIREGTYNLDKNNSNLDTLNSLLISKYLHAISILDKISDNTLSPTKYNKLSNYNKGLIFYNKACYKSDLIYKYKLNQYAKDDILNDLKLAFKFSIDFQRLVLSDSDFEDFRADSEYFNKLRNMISVDI